MRDEPRKCVVCASRGTHSKCNGELPCNWCSGRKRDPDLCAYPNPEPREQGHRPPPPEPTPPPPPPPPQPLPPPPAIPPANPEPQTQAPKKRKKKSKSSKKKSKRRSSKNDKDSSSEDESSPSEQSTSESESSSSDSDGSSSDAGSESDSSDSEEEGRHKRRKLEAQAKELKETLGRVEKKLEKLDKRRKKKKTKPRSSKVGESSKTVRHRPDMDTNKYAPAVPSRIPRVAFRIMEAKWKQHLPLSLLIDSYCETQDALRNEPETMQLDEEGKLTVAPIRAPRTGKDERDLVFTEWLQGWERLMTLIEQFFPKNARYWHKHWKRVSSHPDRERKWRLLVLYDIELWQRSTQEVINVGRWQKHIWKRIEDEHRSRPVIMPAPAPTPGPSRFSAPQPSQAPRYDIPPQQTNRPLAGNQHPTSYPKAGPSRPQGLSRCFRCGIRGHPAVACKAKERPDGKPFLDAPSHQPNAEKDHTFAHSAEPGTTGHNNAHIDLQKVVTPLLPDRWEAELRALDLLEDFGDVPSSLRMGFRIGANGPVLQTYTPPNHKSALEHPEAVQNHITTELNAGRYSGPYSKTYLISAIGPFQTAPLGVVKKSSSPGNFRIIQDFSFPHDHSSFQSLNSQINPEDFPCAWGFFADVANAVRSAAEGSEGATFDVDSAYQRIPVCPVDKPHIVVMWGKSFYLDHAVPFGAASSNGLFGRCGDAIARIFVARGFGLIFKWVNDFLFIRSPTGPCSQATTTEADIYGLADQLGWPWKRSKTKNFSPSFTYLGFNWCLSSRSVHIPQAKREKYIARIHTWLHTPLTSLQEMQVLIGSLVHCSLAIPDGRPQIAELIRFSSIFSTRWADRFRKLRPSPRARAEALWWHDRLTNGPFGTSLTAPPPLLHTTIHSDASTSFGIGIVVGSEWSSWRLLQGWRQDGRNIGWAEAVGVELALERLIEIGTKDAAVTIHCDNQGVVDAWKAGRSRNHQQNQTIVRIMARAAEHNIWVNLEYIRTTENLADKPSRGIAPSGLTHKPTPFALPPHLRVDLAPVLHT